MNTTTHLGERLLSTDLLFKNFFDSNVGFGSFMESKPKHPVDVFTKNNTLCFDIACVGLEKSDINITIEGNTLKVVYNRTNINANPSDEEAPVYLHKGIARRSFNMGWKVSPEYNLLKLDATMRNGLLQITVPKSKEALPKVINIK